MSDFHKWRRQYQRNVWGDTALTEIEWSLADLELCWQEATKQERERCIGKCEEVEAHWRKQAETHNLDIDYGRRDGAIFCVAAIREQEAE